jgi:hypothetical protein
VAARRRHERIEEHVAEPLEGLDGGGVLDGGQGGLAGQVGAVRGAAGDPFEGGVVAEGVVVVPVRVAREDALDAGADVPQEGVRGQAPVAGAVQGVGERLGEPDAQAEPADGEEPGVAGGLARRRLDHQGVPKKSRTRGRADGILSGCLPGRGE